MTTPVRSEAFYNLPVILRREQLEQHPHLIPFASLEQQEGNASMDGPTIETAMERLERNLVQNLVKINKIRMEIFVRRAVIHPTVFMRDRSTSDPFPLFGHRA